MKQKVKKNKNNDSDLVTRYILRQELKRFATKDDLKRFATKEDFSNFKKNDFSNFKLDILAEINRAELRTIDREQNYHSNVMTQFDKIMKKLETMRQENAIDNFQRDERIKVLESA